MVNKDPDWSIFSNMFLSKSFFQQPMVCEVLWLDGKFTHFYVIDNYAWPHCEASAAQVFALCSYRRTRSYCGYIIFILGF